MPREHRKRGQRKTKRKEGEELQEIQETPSARAQSTAQTQPSWIEDAAEAPVVPENNFEAPWGYVDPDVKAYFRTVEEQMLEWQSSGKLQRDEAQIDKDPNQGKACLVLSRGHASQHRPLERRLFFAAALQEMQGKELQLATDPDCSNILERMVYSMDDLVRRLFIENYLGS
jgi:nucleolar protein 9